MGGLAESVTTAGQWWSAHGMVEGFLSGRKELCMGRVTKDALCCSTMIVFASKIYSLGSETDDDAMGVLSAV